MKPPNVVDLPVIIDVHDVMGSMKCSRTTAYRHMRAALGRAPGERVQLRVPLLRMAPLRASAPTLPRQTGPSAQQAPTAGPVPLTRPRTKPRSQSRTRERD